MTVSSFISEYFTVPSSKNYSSRVPFFFLRLGRLPIIDRYLYPKVVSFVPFLYGPSSLSKWFPPRHPLWARARSLIPLGVDFSVDGPFTETGSTSSRCTVRLPGSEVSHPWTQDTGDPEVLMEHNWRTELTLLTKNSKPGISGKTDPGWSLDERGEYGV